MGKEKAKVIFMGATKFSEQMLYHLLQNGVDIKMLFTIPEEFHISYSESKVKNYNYADLGRIALDHGIPCYEVDSISGKKMSDYHELIESVCPDIILALGWYYMVPKSIRDLSKYGVWGIHASLLPKYAGGAPLVWAIINGEKEAGVTLFRIENGVDDGDIIRQKAFPIGFEETIKEAYDKAIYYSKDMLKESIFHVEDISFRRQNKPDIEIYPQRSPGDGKIDLRKTALEIYNFIRAQTRPYPGAFTTINGEKLTIWKVRYEGEVSELSVHMFSIFKRGGRAFVALHDGCMELMEVSLGGQEGDMAVLADKMSLWNKTIGT